MNRPRMNQAECFATAPQGNVMQASHKYVTSRKPFVLSVTNTVKFGEAEHAGSDDHPDLRCAA